MAGVSDQIGVLEKGKQANFLVVAEIYSWTMVCCMKFGCMEYLIQYSKSH